MGKHLAAGLSLRARLTTDRACWIIITISNNKILLSCRSGHSLLDGYEFDRVVIDECAQSIEPASLIPLSKGCSTLVLIGDYSQLPATILSREASARGECVNMNEFTRGSADVVWV